jgi:hypothetical protein
MEAGWPVAETPGAPAASTIAVSDSNAVTTKAVLIISGIGYRARTLDFPFGFPPTTSAALFRDFLPAPHICKPFFQSQMLA